MRKIFISYRRADAAFAAGGLGRDLRRRFGEEHVFRDRENIRGGAVWRQQVLEEIGADSVILVLIGHNWLEMASGGQRRLDDPADSVRMEIVDGIRDGALIIPVLLDNAAMPKRERLPPEIQQLCEVNALNLRDGDWQYDVDSICATLERAGFAPAQRPSRALPTSIGQDKAPVSWKSVTGLLLAVLVFAGLTDPLTPDERDGAFVMVFASFAFVAWAWHDLRSGVREGIRRGTWLNGCATVIAVLAFFYTLGKEPNEADEGTVASPDTSASPAGKN
jgi:hypothetical protein